jgi:hypothetical protein
VTPSGSRRVRADAAAAGGRGPTVRRRHSSLGHLKVPPARLLRINPADYPSAGTPIGSYGRWAAEVRVWAADHDGWVGHVNPVEVWALYALARRTIPPDHGVHGGQDGSVTAPGSTGRQLAPVFAARTGQPGRVGSTGPAVSPPVSAAGLPLV